MEKQPPAVAELAGRVHQGPDPADIAEAEPAQVQVRIAGVCERDMKRLHDSVRVGEVDLAREPQPKWIVCTRDQQVLVGVHRTRSY
jgi:hypothetical protein